MKKFQNQDFLLSTKTAQTLYHKYAKVMPIIDYHNHLSAKEIYENKNYENITQAWLLADHYKWRILRTNGIEESIVTGSVEPKVKFDAWAKTIPYCIGNPIYHWTHLELKRYFNVEEQLSEQTADEIYNKCNNLLSQKEFTPQGLLKQMNVQVVCTTDDPKDDLFYHKECKGIENLMVLPTYRPDNAVHIERETFSTYIKELGLVVGYNISDIDLLLKALEERLEYFIRVGCIISDHGMDEMLYKKSDFKTVNQIFNKGLHKEFISKDEMREYMGYILIHMGKLYKKNNIVMQIHMSAIRNNSTRMFNNLGADSGFDSINDSLIAKDLSAFLDDLDKDDKLPKTILYTLNPRDNELIASMCGNFQGGGIKGKIQFGSGWWFNDQKDGMERQMEALSQMGMISHFVGMLTDSRSFLSFPRHEYFRRILCNKIGDWVENGEYPEDIEFLGEIVQNICYNNIKAYLDIK